MPDAPEQTRDLMTRSIQLRAATLNEEERSVEAAISTETPAQVMDYRSWELIDEVLRADGARIPEQMPLLAAHQRWNLDGVLGSIRSIRVEDGQLLGRLFFADGDEQSERAWKLVRQGHLTDVSVGYRVDNYVDIPPGKSQTINGKPYTAGQRTLRVSTEWTPKEGSLVPIGADPKAKVREESPGLGGPQLVSRKEPIMEETLQEGQRAAAETVQAQTQPVEETRVDPSAVANQAVEAERNRVRSIRQLAGSDVPQDVLTRAIDEGWDESRASREFLTAVRSQRQQPEVPFHPTAQTMPTGNASVRSLAAGLLASVGINDPSTCVMHTGRRDPLPGDRLTAQDAEQGQRFSRLSLVDMVRLSAEIDTGRRYLDIEEAFQAVRSAPSGGTLAYAFTTSMYAKLLEGWGEVADTTVWCDEEDVPNFLLQEDISLSASARLERLPRGDTAKDATLSDSHETYKIARYAKKFSADDQDIIDDRFGAIMRMPSQMGAAARRLRPDLVYSLLLANANLADTGALFNNTAVTTAGGHANLTTAVLGATGLKAAILAMGKYRDGDQVLNIRPRFLIVPAKLQWTAKEILTSTAQAYTAAAAAATPSQYYPINVLIGEGLTLVVDDRIGLAGCTDPTTGTARAGLDDSWYLSAGGSRTVRVAYRRGTNRQPSLRSYMLDRGQWGMGWDINMDIGAKALDYRGLHKSTGAG